MIDMGADVNHADIEGRTAVMIAESRGRLDVSSELIGMGAAAIADAMQSKLHDEEDVKTTKNKATGVVHTVVHKDPTEFTEQELL